MSAVAVLVGNGLSIAQRSALALPSLTSEIRDRINNHSPIRSGDEVSDYLSRMAHAASTGDPDGDFEALLGPLDVMSDSLKALDALRQVLPPPSDVEEAIATTSGFIRDVRRIGVGHALEVIAERSYAGLGSRQVVEGFVDSVLGLSARPITIATLNYDLLLHAVLAERASRLFCDLSAAHKGTRAIEIVPGYHCEALGLRSRPDFPSRRVRLLHLHGELTWLRDPSGRVVRVSTDDLRASDFLEAFREGRSIWEPEVVLTNQSSKSGAISRYPFSMAYDAAADGLIRAERWLIVGYSFRDGCVNDLLAKSLARRSGQRTRILVVTKGGSPTRAEVVAALSDPAASGRRPLPSSVRLRIKRGGVESMAASGKWAWWSGGAPA